MGTSGSANRTSGKCSPGFQNKLGITPEYLSTQFRKETGNTFSNYIRDYRIKKSKELLLGTQLKLHQISAQIGYRSACGSAIIRL